MTLGEPSQKVIDQRLRNRIMEALSYLPKGADGARWEGLGEWFESFFDYFPYEGPEHPSNSAISDSEWTLLLPVIEARCNARSATKASGWPDRIAPLAQAALEVFTSRGQSSEDTEEETPSR